MYGGFFFSEASGKLGGLSVSLCHTFHGLKNGWRRGMFGNALKNLVSHWSYRDFPGMRLFECILQGFPDDCPFGKNAPAP